MAELTVPKEEGKRKGKVHRAVICMLTSRVFIYPVEVGFRGYMGISTHRFVNSLKIAGSKLRKALRDLAEEAEQGNFWPWLLKMDKVWGDQGSWGWLQGSVGRCPYCCSTTSGCSTIKGVKHQ